MSILSVVDLPAPFPPMIPSVSPGLTSKDTSRTAQKSPSASASARRVLPVMRRTSAGTRSRRLSCSSPRWNRFHTPSNVMPALLI